MQKDRTLDYILQYLASMPKTAAEGVVIVSAMEDKAQCEAAVKADIPVVSAEFVLSGVLRQEVEVNSYPLYMFRVFR